jgi:4-amino-4-deoxy-L-arabinose transferase-like glycosyltransferase
MPSTAPTRRFWLILGVIVAVGFAIRLAYVLVDRQYLTFGGDAFYYHAAANLFADGRGFIDPFHAAQSIETAQHPPLYTIWLSIPSVLGMRSQTTHLVWSAVLGTGTVLVLGLTGREVGGERTGLLAAAIAAIAPNLWVPDGSLMAETVSMFTMAVALLAAYRYWARPRWGTLVIVGVAAGAGALSRSELMLVVPLLVVPLALLAPGLARRDRLVQIGAACAAALIVITPWVAYNLSRFEQPEILSSQFGLAMSSTNCDAVWHNEFKSYFSQLCSIELDKKLHLHGDASVQDAAHRDAGIRYVRHHLGEFPRVLAARALAIVGLYHPSQQIAIDANIEGRGMTLARLGMYSFYATAVLSIVGAVAIRRRREVPVFPLLVPPVIVMVTVLAIYASTRFRTTAEVALCVLAAAGIDVIIRGVVASRRREPVPTDA